MFYFIQFGRNTNISSLTGTNGTANVTSNGNNASANGLSSLISNPRTLKHQHSNSSMASLTNLLSNPGSIGNTHFVPQAQPAPPPTLQKTPTAINAQRQQQQQMQPSQIQATLTRARQQAQAKLLQQTQMNQNKQNHNQKQNDKIPGLLKRQSVDISKNSGNKKNTKPNNNNNNNSNNKNSNNNNSDNDGFIAMPQNLQTFGIGFSKSGVTQQSILRSNNSKNIRNAGSDSPKSQESDEVGF